MTGKTDWVTDGNTVISLHNGHELLGKITGSGCIVGTSIAAFCAAANQEAREEGKLLEGSIVGVDALHGAIAG